MTKRNPSKRKAPEELSWRLVTGAIISIKAAQKQLRACPGDARFYRTEGYAAFSAAIKLARKELKQTRIKLGKSWKQYILKHVPEGLKSKWA